MENTCFDGEKTERSSWNGDPSCPSLEGTLLGCKSYRASIFSLIFASIVYVYLFQRSGIVLKCLVLHKTMY